MAKIHCVVDDALLANLRPCMTDDQRLSEIKQYAVIDPFANTDGFPYCCISKNAIVYSCGAIARRGELVSHDHPPGEIALCRRLANAAAGMMNGINADVGSEGTPEYGTDYFHPFFRAAEVLNPKPDRITSEFVQSVFGGTLAPKSEVKSEDLTESADWWQRLMQSYSGYPDEDHRDAVIVRWRSMIEWFTKRPSFRSTAFITIRAWYGSGGSVFPTLILGMTHAGSIAGILGNGVHT